MKQYYQQQKLHGMSILATMKKIIGLLLVCSLTGACKNINSSSTTGSAGATGSAGTRTTGAPQCYAYTQNGDTIQLSFIAINNKVTGHLLYRLKEKDRNEGNVQGSMDGDTLMANYTFSSEGMQSVRQVAFVKEGTGLKEGFGEVEEKEGRMVFKNTAGLRYTGFLLRATVCE